MTIILNGTTGITTPDITSTADIDVNGLTVGRGAGAVATNTAVGASALASATSGGGSVAIGYQAMQNAADTFGQTVAVGYQAGRAITSGGNNTFVGLQSGLSTTTANDNSGFGLFSLKANTTGGSNTAIGREALQANTTGSNSTSVGYQAGYSNTIGNANTHIGRFAGYTNSVSGNNLYVGDYAGYFSTGADNTFVGARAGSANGEGAGYQMTTGSKNTIIGKFGGNQGGLDIRTASNHIVLSDGDGNPRFYIIANGVTYLPGVYDNTTAEAANVVSYSGGNGDMYRSVSALKYKQDIRDVEDFDINALRPVRYKSKCASDDQTKDHLGIIADEAAESGFEELVRRNTQGEVEGFQYERLTVVLLKSIQSLKAEFDAYKLTHP